jgi:hypothetical protein
MSEQNEDAEQWTDRKVDDAQALYDRHGRIFHGVWIATGFIVVAAGLAMIVFPGPVTVVVPLGLVMLAAVFGWARRLLLKSVEYGEEASEQFQAASKPVKALTVAASAAIAGAIIAWMVL